jgi:signal transduction histidine kinase/CheY-like chemotaxis protein
VTGLVGASGFPGDVRNALDLPLPGVRWLAFSATSPGTSREYTIGLDSNPPFQYWNAAGKASGAMPDLLEVAARRAGIRLRWVRFDGTPEAALQPGSGIDLWPLVQIRGTPRTFHTTQAFARAETLLVRLVGRRGVPVTRLGVGVRVTAQQWARQRYPGARHERPEDASGIQSLCEGALDATLAESPAFDAMLLDRPGACAGKRFDVQVIPELNTDYAMAASAASAETADLLRHHLGEMAREGVLDEIFQAYYPLSHYRSAETFAETQTERARRMVRWGVAGLAALCGVMWIGLRRSRRKAAAAVEMAEMRARFLANISHELRTPLNGVLGLASVLDSTALDRTQKEYVGLIRSSGEILLRTVNEVLDFSKLEAGKQAAMHEPVAFEELLEGVISVLAPVAQQKGLNLEWAVEEGLPVTILSDESALRQTLMNLAGNAIKFTGEGTVAVTAGLHEVGDGSSLLRIAVSDSGPGIAPGQEEAVFNPFVRGSDPRTQAIIGTGLGLSITKRLVLLMGGSIHVRNNPERGCTFEVLLPLTESDLPASARPACRMNHRIPGKTLLVTDRPISLEMLGRRLLSAGGSVSWADGEGELRTAMGADEQWDLIVLDDSLPGDRERLAGELRQHPCASRAAIVLMTSAAPTPAKDGAGLAMAEALAPCVGWYRKPFLSELFCSFLENLQGEFGDNGRAVAERAAPDGAMETVPVSEAGATATQSTGPGSAGSRTGLERLRGATNYCPGAPGRCEECVRASAGTLVNCLAEWHPETERPVALVADDNPVNRKVAVSLLQSLGIGCNTAESGEQALDLFRSQPYAWVVMDWHMPGMDGIAALQRMREQEDAEKRRPAPMILCTASSESDPALLERWMEPDAILMKPITLRSLQKALEESACRRYAGHPCPERALAETPPVQMQ